MKNALKLEWFYQRTFLTRKLNGLISFGLKVPLVKELFPSEPYDTFQGKKVLFIILFVLNILKTLLAKGLWLFLGFLLGQNLKGVLNQPHEQLLMTGLLGWFLLTVILYNGGKHLFSSSFDKETQTFVQQFQIDRKIYLQGSLIVDAFVNAAAYLPAAIVMAALFKSWWLPLWIFSAYIAGIFFFEYLHRLLLKERRKDPNWIAMALILFLITALTAAVGYLILTREQPAAAGPFGILGFVLLAVICFWGIKSNPEESYFLQKQIEKGNRYAEAIKTKDQQYVASGINMQKDLTINKEETYSNLSGSQYLNALLFQRYRHILGKRVRIQTVILAVIAFVLIGIRLFAGPFDIDEKAISALFPTLFFIIYLADFGRTIVQMVFVNCDRAMLYYPFYREPKTIISGFNYRFFKSFLYNSTLCGGIFLLAFLFSALNQFSLNWIYLGTLAFLLIGLNFLFSFHALFVYYMLQPFTGDMEVVNPLYKVVSGATYFVAYMNIQLKFTGLAYALIVAAASLMYVGIGFLVLYKKAPQTFKIK